MKLKLGMFFIATCALLAGCGGSFFTSNTNVALYVNNSPSQNIELIVAPTQGRETDNNACTAVSNGFGCTREISDIVITYRFSTTSQSSTDPFYVYLKNKGDTTLNTAIDVRMDDKQKFVQSVSLPPKTTVFVAKIFRTSAQNMVKP